MKKIIGFLIVALTFLIFPVQALAVDFTINETNIEAFLQENGNVEVVEFHTYEFDGDFNGITRSLIPKSGTDIINIEAVENGNALEIEQDDELYRIYRSGEDETITIELSYTIIDGVDVYADLAEFHWPFFDTSNEADYENMTISIHPPAQAFDVLAYGEDEAYKTEEILDDGTVIFSMGFVESGSKGDIRAAFESTLFPAATSINDGNIREKILEDEQEIADKAANFAQTKETISSIAPIIVSVFVVFLLGLLFYAWRKKQTTDHEAERIYHSPSIVPKAIMSMPATVYYYRNYLIDFGELLSIGMMDLVRKRNIEALEDGTYREIDSRTDYKHETTLLTLLFKKIGKDNLFSFDLLEAYTKSATNHSSFQLAIHGYLKELLEEINSHQLYDKHLKLRWTTAILSLLLIPAMIFFGIYELYVWLLISFFLMFAILAFAAFFNPKTAEGKVIKERWKNFEKDFEAIDSRDWEALDLDDKERALLFSSGLANKGLREKNKQFIENFGYTQTGSAMPIYLMLAISTTGTTSFTNASNVSGASGGGSGSSFAGSGTGVGGGGGGSGAF